MGVLLLPFLKSKKKILDNTRYGVTLSTRRLWLMEGDMKRFLWVTPILFVLMSGSAFGTSVSIGFFPNDGSGDNFRFLQQGGGIVIVASSSSVATPSNSAFPAPAHCF